MKTRSFLTNMVLVSSLVFFGNALISCEKEKDNDTNKAGMYTVSGSASGSQMVPSVAGSGTASISGTYSSDTKVLTYTTTWSNLSGGPTAAAFYSGATGANGAVVGSLWTLGTGLSGTGSFSSNTTLTAEQEVQLLNGNMYYALSTATHTTGEVRGQITATPQ